MTDATRYLAVPALLGLVACGPATPIVYFGGSTAAEDAAALRLTCKPAGLAALAEADRLILAEQRNERPRINPQPALDRAAKACAKENS